MAMSCRGNTHRRPSKRIVRQLLGGLTSILFVFLGGGLSHGEGGNGKRLPGSDPAKNAGRKSVLMVVAGVS